MTGAILSGRVVCNVENILVLPAGLLERVVVAGGPTRGHRLPLVRLI